MNRVAAVVVLALVAAGAAAYALGARGTADEREPRSMDVMATEIGAPVMEHLYRGHVPGRSGEIMLVPKPHNFLVGAWDLTTLGSDTPDTSTSHPNPWNYLARVPIILYGPGYFPKGLDNYSEVDISALAPTYAAILGMDFESEGEPFAHVSRGAKPPKAIVTVVIDGGGWNALQQHPDAHPAIDSLRAQGITYVNATIGSAPSITGALHATFGTGDYPIQHGIPGNQMRDENGENVDTWLQNADPRYLETPTVSELWDEQNDNQPVVATVSYEGWHLGMIGHGGQRDGGDKDVAVLWEAEEREWWTNEDYYELPAYLQETDLSRLEAYEEELDARDGLKDGTWFGHTLEQLQEDLTRPATPAFVSFTGDAALEVMQKEKVGRDSLTDFMWIEMKQPDYAGHAFNMLRPEQEDVMIETDRQIARYKEWLDRSVGEGNYVLAVSADHGQQPLPDTFGGWRINNKELEADLEAELGNVIEKTTPVDMYVSAQSLRDNDVSEGDIIEFLSTYTIGDNVPDNAPGTGLVPQDRLDDELFAGAFTSDYLSGLSPDQIESLGDGNYPEGDFTIEPEG